MSKQKLPSKFAGFTLIEVLIYTAILSLIVGAITGFVFLIYRYQTSVEDRINVNEDLRVLNKNIRDDMYLGTHLTVNSGQHLIITNPNNNFTVEYYLSNKQVMRILNGGTAVAITNKNTDVRVFNVTDVSSAAAGGAIRIELTIANFPSGTLKPEVVESITYHMGLKFV